MIKKLIFDSLTYSIPTIISRFLSILLIPIYANFLSPDEFGVFDLLMAFVGLANILISFEVIQGFARFLSEPELANKKNELFSTTFWFRAICFLLFFSFCYLKIETISFLILKSNNYSYEFSIALAYLFINSILYTLQSLSRWNLNSRIFSISSIVQIITTGLATLFFIIVKQESIKGLLFGLICGSLAGIVICLPSTGRYLQLKIDSIILKKLLVFSWPLTFSSLGIWINLYIDRYLLNYFLGPHEVGVYGLAARIAGSGLLLAGGFQFALTPLIYANQQNNETPRIIQNVFSVFYTLAIIFYCCIILMGREIIHLISSEKFEDSRLLLVYLIPALLINNMTIFTPGIEIAKKTKYIVLINILSCILSFTLNILLIPQIKTEGAALAALISSIFTLFLYNIFSQKFYKINFNLLKKLGFFILLFMCLFNLQTIKLPWLLNILFVCFVVCIGIIYQKNNLKKIQDICKR